MLRLTQNNSMIIRKECINLFPANVLFLIDFENVKKPNQSMFF